MSILTNFQNGGNQGDFRQTFNAMLADIVALKADVAGLKAGGTGTPAPTLTGFYRNSSANSRLKAMLASGSGTIGQDGDSTSMGANAASTVGGAGSAENNTNARVYRPASVLAGLLTADSHAARDDSAVGDNNSTGAVNNSSPTQAALPGYDPRFTHDVARCGAITGTGVYAGGNFLGPLDASVDVNNRPTLTFKQDFPVDTYVIWLPNQGGQFFFQIDGTAGTNRSAPGASATQVLGGGAYYAVNVPNTAGFTVVTLTGSLKAQTLTVLADNTACRIARIRGYNSAAASIGITCYASSGAGSADRAASGSGWRNLDQIVADANALHILDIGLNNAQNAYWSSSTPTNYRANLNTYINAIKPVSDILLVSPHPANPSTFAAVDYQNQLRAVAKDVAAQQGIAYFDMFENQGGWSTTIANKLGGGGVHPIRSYYAELWGATGVYGAIKAMAA